MNIRAQCLSHFSASNIRNGMQCQTVVQFVVVEEIFADTVDNQVQQLVLFVQEKRNGEITNLLF